MGFLDDLRGKSGKTDLLEKEDLSPTDEGDHERFAHYVDKWIPNRDPQKFPVCPTCKEIHARLK
jgi:hypothetical protein